MPNSKTAPDLNASWQVDVDSHERACIALSQSDCHEFLRQHSLWIQCDEDFAATQRKLNPHAGELAWMIPCENASKGEPDSPTSSATDYGAGVQIAPVAYNAMPSATTLSSYAAIELACYESNAFEDEQAGDEPSLERLRIHWPLDVETPSQMSAKIEVVRTLTEPNKPVGVAIPLISVSDEFFESLRWLLDCRVDWIHWILPAACLGDDHQAIEYLVNDPFSALESIQKWLAKSTAKGSKTPAIVIEYPWTSGYQAAELIRKGANSVVLPACSKVIQEAKQQTKSTRDLPFASSFLGATLGYTPSSYLPSLSQVASQPQANARQALEVFYRQFKSFLAWSER